MKKIFILLSLALFLVGCATTPEQELAEHIIAIGKQASQIDVEILEVDKSQFPEVGDVIDVGGSKFKVVQMSDEPFEYTEAGSGVLIMLLDYKYSVEGESKIFLASLGMSQDIQVDPTKPEVLLNGENFELGDYWLPGTYALLRFYQ